MASILFTVLHFVEVGDELNVTGPFFDILAEVQKEERNLDGKSVQST